jgi:hypothetical protein
MVTGKSHMGMIITTIYEKNTNSYPFEDLKEWRIQ